MRNKRKEGRESERERATCKVSIDRKEEAKDCDCDGGGSSSNSSALLTSIDVTLPTVHILHLHFIQYYSIRSL